MTEGISIAAGVASILSFLLALASYFKSQKNEEKIKKLNVILNGDVNDQSQKVSIKGDRNFTVGGDVNNSGKIDS